jgi:uncharacterized membrane protein YhaH (DUF805 family)
MNLFVRPWRHCFDFRGRSRRLEGVVFLATLLAGIPVVGGFGEVVTYFIGAPFPSLALGGGYFSLVIEPGGWPLLVYLALCIAPALALGVRRLHDFGLSGLLLLVLLVPIIGLFFGVVLAVVMTFLRDAPGPNRYGPDPRVPEPISTDELDEVFS